MKISPQMVFLLVFTASLAPICQAVEMENAAPALGNDTLLSALSDPLLKRTLYRMPAHHMVGGIGPDGAISVNSDWEKSGKRGPWFIEQQRYGASLIQAGVAMKDNAYIDEGIKILEWGFKQEAADGSFPGTGDPHHSTSFFLEASTRSLLLFQQTGDAAHLAIAERWKPKIAAMARWILRPEVAEAPRQKTMEPYTHRFYLLAAGLAQAGAVTGEKKLQNYAYYYAEDGLSRQRPDGTNPEKGGLDASYQGVGCFFASCFYYSCPDEGVRGQIRAMLARALDREMTKIGPDGTVSLEGSTRTPLEAGRSGKPKTMDYKVLVQALVLGAHVTGDAKYHQAAESVARNMN